ncbi:MAG: HNH endonuclease [bacterium]|nr:HNH endonuclease [bacterium]
MKIWAGVTDIKWFEHLRHQSPPVAEVNFWIPGGTAPFNSLPEGSPFLFKLKAPINKIAGVGFFFGFRKLPLRLAWETFKLENGRNTYEELAAAIAKYRRQTTIRGTEEIGCMVLEQPVFFPEEAWITAPEFSTNIVQGKSYDTHTSVGALLWKQVYDSMGMAGARSMVLNPQAAFEPVFGKEYLRKSRPGQGAFRLLLTDVYGGRCAITGESTRPVLEAAHIQPVTMSGKNEVTNGLLLRSDMHILFDDGLIGVTPDYEIRISDRIREQYVNGKVYYAWDGKKLSTLPSNPESFPSRERLEWHMSHIFES